MTAVLEGIAPIVAVSDPQATAVWFVGTLGFEHRAAAEDGSYALVARGEAGVILVGPADADSLDATANHVSAYIWVNDLDALWAELSPRLDALPAGSVRPPFEQTYGMREFHVKDPDGFLILFGQSTAREA